MNNPDTTMLFEDILYVRMSPRDKSLWERYCALHFEEVAPSAVARSMLMQIASEEMGEAADALKEDSSAKVKTEKRVKLSTFQKYKVKYVMGEADHKTTRPKRIKRSFYLLPSEDAAIVDLAEKEKKTISLLIGTAVRSMLRINSEPLPSDIDRLRKINDSLAILQNNTNQIATKLNSGGNYRAEELQLDRMWKRIDIHRTAVKKYIASVDKRWRLELHE